MASQELALREDNELVAAPRTGNLSDLQRLGNILAASGYFADAREMAQAAVKVLAGQELGLPPIASMMGINIIKGKVALGVHLIASRVRAHGYDFRFVRHDNTGCVIEFQGKPEGGKRRVLGESSFTEDDAKAAQVFGEMYKKYPRNMYYSRAMSNGAKWYTPEIFGGAPVYTPEELGATVDDQGEMIRPEPSISTSGIDTGGHAVGTQAAANFVRDRKLAEARTEPPRATQAAPAGKAEERVDPEILAVWKRMGTTITSVCALFKETKEAVKGFDGHEDIYYQVLRKYGTEHANELLKAKGGLENARAAIAELFVYLKKRAADEAAAQQEALSPECDAIADHEEWGELAGVGDHKAGK